MGHEKKKTKFFFIAWNYIKFRILNRTELIPTKYSFQEHGVFFCFVSLFLMHIKKLEFFCMFWIFCAKFISRHFSIFLAVTNRIFLPLYFLTSYFWYRWQDSHFYVFGSYLPSWTLFRYSRFQFISHRLLKKPLCCQQIRLLSSLPLFIPHFFLLLLH